MIKMSESIEIIPLGTVSPYPKGKRNNPGFLVKYKDYRFYQIVEMEQQGYWILLRTQKI